MRAAPDGRGDRTRSILEMAPDAFVALDASGVITDWNTKASETFGWTRAEAVGRGIADLITPGTDLALRAGKTLELLGVQRDGRVIPIEIAVGALEGEGGPTLFAFIRDITHRHTTEEMLRARERQLSEALTLASLGSWSWDIASDDVSWSTELFDIFGLEPGTEVTLETYLAHVHDEDRHALEQTIAESIQDGTPFECDHRIVRASDRSVRWLHCHGEVVKGELGPERLYGTAEDVTESRQAERTQSLLAAIVESTDDAIKSMATDGTIISWNAAAEQLYGYTAEEFLGHPVLELFPPEEVDGVLAVFKRVVQGGHVERCELKQLRKDGALIDVAATLSPIRVGGTIVGVSAVSRDVTARKRAQEALQSALEREQTTVRELQDLDRLRNDFISDVSHELRTPLTSISGYAELLSGGSFGDINSQQGDALDVIYRNTKRLLDLIEDIMALSRMESGVFSLTVEPTDLERLIVAAGDAIASAAEAKSITLTVNVDRNIGFGVVDPSQLDRALLNVLSNAVKFTQKGGRVRLDARRVGTDVVISVADNGMGIDISDQKQVFKRFFRSSLATRSAIQGTGLGLVITKTIVDHHQGTISLESAPGRGTTVHIRIPANAQSAVAV
jgi:PAS domain S-box-containing protein